MLIAVDQETGEMVALSPASGIEIARARVADETTYAHVAAAENLITFAFEALQVEGYERAVGQ
jgi:hypothetical protein